MIPTPDLIYDEVRIIAHKEWRLPRTHLAITMQEN